MNCVMENYRKTNYKIEQQWHLKSFFQIYFVTLFKKNQVYIYNLNWVIYSWVFNVKEQKGSKKRVERSQLRWFRHLIEMPPGSFSLEVYWAHPLVGDPREILIRPGNASKSARRTRNCPYSLDWSLAPSSVVKTHWHSELQTSHQLQVCLISRYLNSGVSTAHF